MSSAGETGVVGALQLRGALLVFYLNESELESCVAPRPT
jgi:hypothetical protein